MVWTVTKTYKVGVNLTGAAPTSTLAWDPSNLGSAISLTNSNLSANSSTAGFSSFGALLPQSTGKRYFEVKTGGTLFAVQIGLIFSADTVSTWNTGLNSTLAADQIGFDSRSSNDSPVGGFTKIGNSPVGTVGDVTGFAIDIPNGNGFAAQNNNYTSYLASSNPATGANPCFTFAGGTSLLIVGSIAGNDGLCTLTIAGSGTSLNGYSPPAGYSWWNS